MKTKVIKQYIIKPESKMFIEKVDFLNRRPADTAEQQITRLKNETE